MERRANNGDRAALAIALILATLLVVIRFASRGIIERGDGVSHYLIARWCWAHPRLLLDHWGKPLFTLLASPFAHFGHPGLAVFNAVIAFCTCWAAMPVLRRAGGFAQALFPLLVLLAPLYAMEVVGGMTEPLFGLLTVIVVSLLVQEHCIAAALVASFTPFARPEYIAFLPSVIAWLLLRKQWKAIPLLITGMAVYAFVGWLMLGDALWYFHNDPYRSGPSIYGSGDPWKFTGELDGICGRPLMVLFISGLLLWPLIRWKDKEERRTHDALLITTAFPSILILAVHMYLWGKGIKGSAGILRVVVTAIPMAGLFAAFTIARAGLLITRGITMKPAWIVAIFSGIVVWQVIDLQQRHLFPVPANADEEALREAGRILDPILAQGHRLFTTHPFMALCADVDPFDPEHYNMLYGADTLSRRLRNGDVIFWDSELGPNESHVPFDKLMNDPHFALIGMQEPTEGHKVIRGVYYELFEFQREDAMRGYTIDTLFQHGRPAGRASFRCDTIGCADYAVSGCYGPAEFPWELRKMVLPPVSVLFDELIISAHVERPGGIKQKLFLVYKQERGDRTLRYLQEEMPAGELSLHVRVPHAPANTQQVLYVWNASQQPFRMTQVLVTRKRWTQQRIP